MNLQTSTLIQDQQFKIMTHLRQQAILITRSPSKFQDVCVPTQFSAFQQAQSEFAHISGCLWQEPDSLGVSWTEVLRKLHTLLILVHKHLTLAF